MCTYNSTLRLKVSCHAPRRSLFLTMLKEVILQPSMLRFECRSHFRRTVRVER